MKDNKKIDKEKVSQKTTELIAKASELPLVKVNREEFLRKTFKNDPHIDIIIEKGPQAVYTVESLHKKARTVINGSTGKTAVASFVGGLPSNPAVALAAAGVDVTQYFGFSINLAQKISYLFGAEEFKDLSSSEAQTKIVLLLGTMFGVETAKNGLVRAVVVAGEAVGKHVAAKALTKTTTWYPILKKIAWEIGQKITKQTVKDAIAKSFSVLGAFISGGITWVSFRPLGNNLANVYVDILSGKYDVDMVLRDDFVNAKDDDVIDVQYEIVDHEEIDEESEDYIITLDLDEIDDDLESKSVWIGDNGNCYHFTDTCASLVNKRMVTIDEAEACGKRMCKRCSK